MQLLSNALTLAQRAHEQAPQIRLQVRDRLLRWRWLGSGGVKNTIAAVCRAATGHIVVAVLDTAGAIRARIVTAPQDGIDPTGEPGYGWGHYPAAYALVLDNALGWPNGDIALSANPSGILRLFYILSDGSELRCVASADGGSTWGPPATVKAFVGSDETLRYCLASGGADHVLWCTSRSGSRYVHARSYGQGAWGSEKTLGALTETGGEFGACHGLSAAWWPEEQCWAVAAAFEDATGENGRIVTARFDPTAESGHETTHVQRIAPPGQAPVGFTVQRPALIRASAGESAGWLLSFTERHSGSAWADGVCLTSRDFDHWSYRLPLAFNTTYGGRLNWVEHGAPGEEMLYAYLGHEVHCATAWAPGHPRREHTVAHEDIVRLQIEETPDGSRLVVDLDNRDGAYDDVGLDGAAVESLHPLAEICVEAGLPVDATGTVERVQWRPFHVWSVARLRSADANWLRIEGYDGFELFRRWRPDATYVFEGRTLGWIIAELAARVGGFAVTFDGSAAWNTTPAYLSVAGEREDWSGRRHIRAAGRWVPINDPAVAFDERNDGYTLLQRLLGLAGGMARWRRDGLHCFVSCEQGAAPAPDYVYYDGEIIAGCYADRFPWPTRVRATGDGAATHTSNLPYTLTAGIEVFAPLHSAQWETAAQCQAAASAALDDALARSKGGWFEARPNLGLELFDVIALTDTAAGGAGYHDIKRRVNTLRTEYDPRRNIWRQVAGIEGV